MKTRVYCFSGGLDSVLALLSTARECEQADEVLLYTRVLDSVSEGEVAAIEQLVVLLRAYMGVRLEHRVVRCLGEEGSPSAFSPQRNLLLVTSAAREALCLYPSTTELDVVLGQAADDDVSDNTAEFRHFATKALQFGTEAEVTVSAPIHSEMKHETMLRLWSQNPVPALEKIFLSTVSCYNGEAIDIEAGARGIYGCGECASCFRAWLALREFERLAGFPLAVFEVLIDARYRVPVRTSDVAREYRDRGYWGPSMARMFRQAMIVRHLGDA